MNWLEVCEDKRLQNLPYKIELNRWGKIEMSPHRREHSLFQGEMAYLLRNLLPHGVALSECAIETTENLKVADVAWASRQRWESMADRVSCSVAWIAEQLPMGTKTHLTDLIYWDSRSKRK